MYADERFRRHETGPFHPERAARLDAVDAGLHHHGLDEGTSPGSPRPATDAELELVHPADYIASIERFCEVEFITEGWDWIDPLKDAEADITSIQAGLDSVQDLIIARGKDPWKVLQDNAAYRDEAKRLGLELSIFAAPEPKAAAPADGEAKEEEDEEGRKLRPPRANRLNGVNHAKA